MKSNGGPIFMGWVEFCPAALSVCLGLCLCEGFRGKGVTVSVGFKEVIVAVFFSNRALCLPG